MPFSTQPLQLTLRLRPVQIFRSVQVAAPHPNPLPAKAGRGNARAAATLLHLALLCRAHADQSPVGPDEQLTLLGRSDAQVAAPHPALLVMPEACFQHDVRTGRRRCARRDIGFGSPAALAAVRFRRRPCSTVDVGVGQTGNLSVGLRRAVPGSDPQGLRNVADLVSDPEGQTPNVLVISLSGGGRRGCGTGRRPGARAGS